MKSTFTLGTAIKKTAFTAIFLPAIFGLVMPEIASADSTVSGQTRLNFKISPNKNAELVAKTQQQQLSYAELISQESVKDTIYKETLASNLEAYLIKNKSPLAIYSKEIIELPQWQRALAISKVESNMGIRCADNNCSGIGVHPKHPSWRRYPTKLDWFKDMTALLEKPIYKERYKTCATMRGVYVVPGSNVWVNGCNKVSNELITLTADSQTQATEKHVAMINGHNTANIATAELEIANLK